MALIAPDICRYTIVGSLNGQDCMNVLDVRITDFALATREELIFEIAGDLLNQWDDHVLGVVANVYTAEQVRWVDLNSADGSTGARSSTDGNTWPANGRVEYPALPNNTYAKVIKVLEGKGRTERNGALRLGGIMEEQTLTPSPNTLTAAAREDINDAFENLKDGINEGVLGASVNLVVVHTVDDEYTGYSEIANFSCAATLGTIRRRMPGYGS